jgi:rod shape-determining protein MreD
MATAKARAPGFPAEAGLARVAAIAGVVVAALALQTTLLARLTLIGVIPQLVLVVVVSLAYLDGESVGVVMGFAGGLLIDLTSLQSIVGLTALVYTLIGYSVGYLRQFATGESVWTPVFAVALASAIAEGSYALMSIILGQAWVGIGFTAKVMGLVTLYNTLLTPFTFPLVRRVADRFRPERVYRW